MSGTSGAAKSAERDQATRESKGCRHCGGHGMVTVYHPEYRGAATILEQREDCEGELRMMPAAATVAAHCVCSLGRFMRRHNEDETNRRIPDLQRVFDGRSKWLERDPTAAGEERHEPRAARSNVRRWVDETAAEEVPF